MPADSVFRHAAEFVVRRVGDETILLPIRSRAGDLDSVFTLNDVARRIWDLVDGRKSVAEIAAIIAAEFEVDSEAAESDIAELLAALEEAHLVEASAGAQP